MTDAILCILASLAMLCILFGGLFAIVGGIALASAPCALYGSLAFTLGAATWFVVDAIA